MYLYSHIDCTIICGDVNSRIGNEKDFIKDIDGIIERHVLDKVKNSYCDNFIDFLKDSKMCILNGRVTPNLDNFTCINARGKSVVDYMLIHQENLSFVSKCEVLLVNELLHNCKLFHLISEKCKVPDHSILSMTFSPFISTKLLSEKICTLPTPKETVDKEDHVSKTSSARNDDSHSFRYDFTRPKPDYFNNEKWRKALLEIISGLEDKLHSQNALDAIYQNFCHAVFSEMNNYLDVKVINNKTRKYFRNSKPYWDDELSNSWKCMAEAKKEFCKYKGIKSIKNHLHSKFIKSRKVFDKLLRQKERQYNRNYIHNLERINTSNPKEFWNKLQTLGSKKKNIPLSVRSGEIITNNIDQVLQKWKNDFSRIYNSNNENTSQFDNESYRSICDQVQEKENHCDPNSLNLTLNKAISYSEVAKQVGKAKRNKAPGVDKIPSEVLKNNETVYALYKMFKYCFQNHCLPSVWLKAVIHPIPKGADKDPYLPMSYRGISLLPTTCKIYTGILNARVTSFLNSQNLICDEQYGFREGKSCHEHVYNISTIIKQRMNRNQTTFAAFIDFEKAFDRINRTLLFYKLLKYNITGNIYWAIKSLYANTYNSIRINSYYTDWFISDCGVRQGDTLSPTLFNIYINDLATELNELHLGINFGKNHLCILLYADDMVLLSDSEEKLQKMLNYLTNWCKKWRVSVNVAKCGVVHFRKTNKLQRHHIFKVNGLEIKTLSKYKYLGVILDEHLNFKDCSETLADSAGRALCKIIGKFKTFKDLHYRTFTKLYDSCVWPILDYCSSVWSFNNYHNSDKVHNRATRFYLGLHRNAPVLGYQADMGWYLPKYRYYVSMIRF